MQFVPPDTFIMFVGDVLCKGKLSCTAIQPEQIQPEPVLGLSATGSRSNAALLPQGRRQSPVWKENMSKDD